MSGDTLASATARLQAAISRIERAIDTRERHGSGMAEAYGELEQRHNILRSRVHEVVQRLDALIDAEEPR
jgi:hypothetical protein